MKVLAILYCYPPFLLPATICYMKLIAGLKAHGSDVAVVTVDPGSYSVPQESMTDPGLVRLMPDGITNCRVPSWESKLLIRALKRFDIGYKTFYRLFEPRKKEWTFPAVRRLGKLEPRQYDVILSCSQPHANHLIGYRLKRKTKKPWIAYFSDPWVNNPYAGYRSERIRRYNAFLEKSVIEHADRILFTSPEMLDMVMRHHRREHARKCDVLPHSFVPAWYEAAERSLSRNSADSGHMGERRNGRMRFIHTGHFYGPRTPKPFLDALARLDAAMGLSEKLEVHFYGTMDRAYHEYLRIRGLDRFVSVRKTVPYLGSLAAMKDADVLFLIDAPTRERRGSVFLPSKLIDYIGSGRPVVGITPEAGASARVLRESGNIVCALEREDGIAETLTAVIDGSLRPRPDAQAIDRYHYLRVSGKIHSIMREMR